MSRKPRVYDTSPRLSGRTPGIATVGESPRPNSRSVLRYQPAHGSSGSVRVSNLNDRFARWNSPSSTTGLGRHGSFALNSVNGFRRTRDDQRSSPYDPV